MVDILRDVHHNGHQNSERLLNLLLTASAALVLLDSGSGSRNSTTPTQKSPWPWHVWLFSKGLDLFRSLDRRFLVDGVEVGKASVPGTLSGSIGSLEVLAFRD